MMKRHHPAYPVLLTLLLTTALVGCQRDPLPERNDVIRFAVGPVAVASTTSKAEELPDINPPTTVLGQVGSAFKVWSSYHTNPADTTARTDVFTPETFTYTQTGSNPPYWKPSGVEKKWEENAFYHFRAAYPADKVSPKPGSISESIQLSYNMHNENYDLMVASRWASSAAQAGDPVHLDFEHACAAVRFVFRKGENEDKIYKITSFELQWLRAIGELTYDGWAGFGSWNVNFGFRDAQIYPESGLDWEVPNTYTAYTAGQWYYVIPQSLSENDGHHPAVKFSYVEGSSAATSTTLLLPEATTWEAGKTYVYYIAVQPDQSTITVEVKPWEKYLVSVDSITFD